MKTTVASLSCHLGQNHPLFLQNVFVFFVNDKVGSRDAPEEDFQKFDLKQFLNKIEKWIQIWRPPQVFIHSSSIHSRSNVSILSDPGSCRIGPVREVAGPENAAI